MKWDKTVKLALESKILNETIHKNKYQMSNNYNSMTYRFDTGFYGLTDMPAEFQKVMD